MSRFIKTFALSICLLLTGWSSISQAKHLEGTVLDASNGAELVGAHIIPMSNWENGVITDVEGKFELTLEVPDTLLVTYIGFYEKIVPVSSKVELTIRLNPKAAQIEALEIVSDRLIAEEFSVKKIRRLEIYKNPNAKADPLLAVNGLPSVTTTDESANISFRGSGPAETGIFFNQVPVYDAVRFSQLNGIGTFSIFNTELTSSVNVFPGNPPLEYGNTTSGLIAINSRDEVLKPITQLSLSMAGGGFFHGSQPGEKKRSNLIAFGNFQPSTMLKAVNPEALEDIPWFRAIDGGIQWSQQLNDQSQLKVFNYTLSEGYDFNFVSPTFQGIFQQRKFRNLTIANYLRRLGSGMLSVNAGYNQSQTDLNYSQFVYEINNRDAYLSVNYHKEKHRMEWKYGVASDYRLRRFEAVIPIYEFALARNHPAIEVAEDDDRLLLDGFGFFKYRPSYKISFGYALRANAPLTTDEVKVGRQSSINYMPFEGHRMIFSRGTYHRFDWIENDALGWISARQLSLDYQWQKPKWEWSVSAYVKEADRQGNSEDILGVETYFRYRPGNRFFWDVSYSYIDVGRLEDDRKGPGMYDLNYFIRSGLEWSFAPLWTLGGRMLWRQGTYVGELSRVAFRDDLLVYEPVFQPISLDSERLPYYQIIDLSLSRLFELTDRINGVAFISASNISDRQNIRGYSYNFDYNTRENQLLSRRTLFAGFVLYLQ